MIEIIGLLITVLFFVAGCMRTVKKGVDRITLFLIFTTIASGLFTFYFSVFL